MALITSDRSRPLGELKLAELWGGLDLNANGSIEYAYSCSRDYEWGSS